MRFGWLKTRQTKYSAYVAVYLAVIVAVLSAANWLAQRHNKSVDLTANKRFSLSDQTEKVVHNLKQDVKIVLQPEGAVKGKVAFADGTAPTAFTIQVGFAQQSFTGGGEFVLDALPPQKYQLSVRGPGFQTRAVDVTVEPAKTADAGTITVVKGRTLAGVVVADGKPVPGATVFAGRQLFGNGTSNAANFGPMGQGAKQDTTDTSGRFTIAGFNAGDLAIVAEHPDIGRSKAMRIPTSLPGQGELVLELQKFGSLSA